MASRLALRAARPLRTAASSVCRAEAPPAVESASAKGPESWPTTPAGTNATAADGSRVRVQPSSAMKRTPGLFESNRNAYSRVAPAFPALQPFFRVAHVVGVSLLVGVTLVTGFETVRGLLTVRANRKEWERTHPEEHAALLKEIADKQAIKKSAEREKYAVSAIDPAGDERRRAEALAIAEGVKKA